HRGLRQPRRLPPPAVRLLAADDADRGRHPHRSQHPLSTAQTLGEARPAHRRLEHRTVPPPQVLHGHRQRRRSRRRTPWSVARTRLQHHETLEGRHTMSALTEIYVDNVVRHLPESTRADIAAEITATIDDTVEARLGENSQPNSERTATVEREVLEELGDPAVLSRAYANSPQHFIGPKSYPLFLWTLRWILPIVGLLAVLANVVLTVATTPDVQIGQLLGSTVGNTVTSLLTAFAAITIIIGLGDRGLDGGAADPLGRRHKGAWTVEDLDRRDARG